jgi:hypothetical protein
MAAAIDRPTATDQQGVELFCVEPWLDVVHSDRWRERGLGPRALFRDASAMRFTVLWTAKEG